MYLLKTLFPILILSCLLSACSMLDGRYSGTVELGEDALYYWPCHEQEAVEHEFKFCSFQCVEVSKIDPNKCKLGRFYEIDMRNRETIKELKSRGAIIISKDILGTFP